MTANQLKQQALAICDGRIAEARAALDRCPPHSDVHNNIAISIAAMEVLRAALNARLNDQHTHEVIR